MSKNFKQSSDSSKAASAGAERDRTNYKYQKTDYRTGVGDQASGSTARRSTSDLASIVREVNTMVERRRS